MSLPLGKPPEPQETAKEPTREEVLAKLQKAGIDKEKWLGLQKEYSALQNPYACLWQELIDAGLDLKPYQASEAFGTELELEAKAS